MAQAKLLQLNKTPFLFHLFQTGGEFCFISSNSFGDLFVSSLVVTNMCFKCLVEMLFFIFFSSLVEMSFQLPDGFLMFSIPLHGFSMFFQVVEDFFFPNRFQDRLFGWKSPAIWGRRPTSCWASGTPKHCPKGPRSPSSEHNFLEPTA